MTISEFRNSLEYREAVHKIERYPQGFVFTLKYASIPKAKANALNVLMRDCCEKGLVESISIGLSIEGEFVSETYRKI